MNERERRWRISLRGTLMMVGAAALLCWFAAGYYRIHLNPRWQLSALRRQFESLAADYEAGRVNVDRGLLLSIRLLDEHRKLSEHPAIRGVAMQDHLARLDQLDRIARKSSSDADRAEIDQLRRQTEEAIRWLNGPPRGRRKPAGGGPSAGGSPGG